MIIYCFFLDKNTEKPISSSANVYIINKINSNKYDGIPLLEAGGGWKGLFYFDIGVDIGRYSSYWASGARQGLPLIKAERVYNKWEFEITLDTIEKIVKYEDLSIIDPTFPSIFENIPVVKQLKIGDTKYYIKDITTQQVTLAKEMGSDNIVKLVFLYPYEKLVVALICYSEYFLKDAENTEDFLAKYPKWTSDQPNESTDFTVANQELHFVQLASGSTKLYEDFSEYSKTVYSVVFEKVIFVNLATVYTHADMYADYLTSKMMRFNQVWTGSQYRVKIQTCFTDNEGSFWGTEITIYSDTHDKYDFKIERDELIYTSYYKLSTDINWTQHFTKTFTSVQPQTNIAISGDYPIDFKIDNIIVDPDECHPPVYYSDDFVLDTVNVTDFQAKYPKWDLANNPTGTVITTSNGNLVIDPDVIYQGVYQDISNYSKTVFSVEWFSVLPFSPSSTVPLLIYHENGDGAQILFSPNTWGDQIRNVIRTDYIEGTHHYGTNNYIDTNDYEAFDFKITRNAKHYEAFYKKSIDSSWIALETYDFTVEQSNYRVYCYTVNVEVKFDFIKFTPDEMRY